MEPAVGHGVLEFGSRLEVLGLAAIGLGFWDVRFRVLAV